MPFGVRRRLPTDNPERSRAAALFANTLSKFIASFHIQVGSDA